MLSRPIYHTTKSSHSEVLHFYPCAVRSIVLLNLLPNILLDPITRDLAVTAIYQVLASGSNTRLCYNAEPNINFDLE